MLPKYLLLLSGIFLAIPVLGVMALAFTLPTSISGIGYILSLTLVVAGLILAPWMRRSSLLTLTGILGISLIVTARIMLGESNSTSRLYMITLPDGQGTHWLGDVIDEQDAIIFGETIFHWIGGDSDNEHAGLTSAFERVYSEMQQDGIFSSPVVGTYLGLQQPDRFDAVIIEPETKAQFGVVFLHGYMGNVSAQCWGIAQAVKELDGVTICPSTMWTGEWWRPEGQQILQRSFEYLRKRGIQTIYLGGFSNGGFSIGRLARQLENEKGLSGLIFIDGFMNGDDVREMGLPVLIIEGTQDERVPVEAARQFVTEVGELGTYIEINSDHFLIMKEPGLIQNAIATWLENNTSP